MAHMLASLQFIKEKVPEPYKQALLERAVERGITYKLKCVYTGTVDRQIEEPEGSGKFVTKRFRRRRLKTKFHGVERVFEVGTEMELPAQVASHIWDKWNVNMVGGSIRHQSTTEAPLDRPCFEEVVEEDRADLGPKLSLRGGGVAAQEDLLVEERGGPMDRNRRAGSDEVSAEEINEVARGAQPAGGSGI